MPKMTVIPMTPTSGATTTTSTTSTPGDADKKETVPTPPIPKIDPEVAAARAAAARAYALSSATADSGGNKPRRRKNNNNNKNTPPATKNNNKKRYRPVVMPLHHNSTIPIPSFPPPNTTTMPPYATPPHPSFRRPPPPSSSSMRLPWMNPAKVPPPPSNLSLPHHPFNGHPMGTVNLLPAAFRSYQPPPKAKRKLSTQPIETKIAPVKRTRKPKTNKTARSSSPKTAQPRSIQSHLSQISSSTYQPRALINAHNIDPDDEEYAKFVKSLIATPGQHLKNQTSPQTNTPPSLKSSNEVLDEDDDDEEEYEVSQSDEDDDEEEEDDDDDEQDDEQDREKDKLQKNEEDKMQDNESKDTNTKNGHDAENDITIENYSKKSSKDEGTLQPSSVSSTPAQSPMQKFDKTSPKTNDLPENTTFFTKNDTHWFDQDDPNFYAELEAELGSLLEEDMEAAVSTLLNGKALVPSDNAQLNNDDPLTMSLLDSTSAGSHHSPMSQSIQNTPSKTSKNNMSKNNFSMLNDLSSHASFVGSNTETMTSATPITSSPLTPNEKNGNGISNGSETPGNFPKTAVQLPPVEPYQILELQELMSHHYQLLLQQSILAVRALHGNKMQKEHNNYVKGFNNQNRDTNDNLESQLDKDKFSQKQKWIADSSKFRANTFFFSGESSDDWAEILDGAVGMLQDLDQNRKDAIRYSILMEETARKQQDNNFDKDSTLTLSIPLSTKSESMEGDASTTNSLNKVNKGKEESSSRRILTRSAFSRTLKERYESDRIDNNPSIVQNIGGPSNTNASNFIFPRNFVWSKSNSLDGHNQDGITMFDVKGLARLKETFLSIDNSVRASRIKFQSNEIVKEGQINILEQESHGEACEMLLHNAGAGYDDKFVPGKHDISEYLSYPLEFFGNNYIVPLSMENQLKLRKSKYHFTAAEDNLLLMGINLYGEKEWSLISNRFLPDRSVSLISQRYAKLCVMIYKANGIHIDSNGNLDVPPVYPNGADDFDEEKIAQLAKVEAPSEFNVHRWSLDEDITLLKAVPLMGHMWAEVASRLIQHRDRGHLRKRYQVLERRVKATIRREKKFMNDRCDSKIQSSSKNKQSEMKGCTPILCVHPPNKKMKNQNTINKMKHPEMSHNPATRYGGAVSHGFGGPRPEPPAMILSSYVNPMISKDKPTNTSSPKRGLTIKKRKHVIKNNPSSFNNEVQNVRSKNKKGAFHKSMSKELHDVKKTSSCKDSEKGEEALLCSENMGSLLPEQNGITKPETMSTPKSIASKSSQGSQFMLSESLSGLDGRSMDVTNGFESTRMGFEKIINDGDDWSQMSRVKKLIEGESRSPKIHSNTSSGRASNAPLSHMNSQEVALLPCLEIHKSTSGLSILNNESRSLPPSKSDALPIKKTGSIMAAVLERTKESTKNTKLKCTESKNMKSKSKTIAGNDMKNNSFIPGIIKHNTNESSFQMMNSGFKPNQPVGPIQHTSSISMMYGGGFSVDSFEFNNLSLSERSRNVLEEGRRSDVSPMNMPMAFSRPFQTYGASTFSPNSLMANDIEAITALNSMSNSSRNMSSLKPNIGMKSQKLNIENKAISSTKKSVKSTTSGKTSLFAKVVGGIQEKDAKKKKQQTSKADQKDTITN